MQAHRTNTKPVRIYTLTNPETGHIFYVGRTTLPLHQRLSSNNYRSTNGNCNPMLAEYLRSLSSRGIKPVIEEIDSTSHANKKIVEEYWIQQIGAWGFALTNVKHHKNKNFTPSIPHEFVSAYDLGVFERLRRRNDIEAIAVLANTSKQTVNRHFYSSRMPGYLKRVMITFYKKRVEELIEWANIHENTKTVAA